MSKKVSVIFLVIVVALLVSMSGSAIAGFIASGPFNSANSYASFVGGGDTNTASGETSFVGAGYKNTASGMYSFVGAGNGNTASGYISFIGGGQSNTASGSYSSVPGGEYNLAKGKLSFAVGYRAKANHDGSFVWADMTEADFASAVANQFSVRATGGVRFVTSTVGNGVKLSAGGGSWETLSDKNSKENFEAVDGKEVLQKLAELPILKWNYKSQSDDIRHIGPMAQDFSAAFGLGHDDRHIATVDTDGIALAAIQELTKELKEKDEKIAEQGEQIALLSDRLEKLERISESGGSAKNNPLTSALAGFALLCGISIVGIRKAAARNESSKEGMK